MEDVLKVNQDGRLFANFLIIFAFDAKKGFEKRVNFPDFVKCMGEKFFFSFKLDEIGNFRLWDYLFKRTEK